VYKKLKLIKIAKDRSLAIILIYTLNETVSLKQ